MKIKVIKKDHIKPEAKATSKRKRTPSARSVVSNVTGWVNDLHARKRDETRTAIEKLFNQQPRPSEL